MAVDALALANDGMVKVGIGDATPDCRVSVSS